MTKFNPTKSILAAVVTGALVIAAPAGASVLDPVSDAWNPGGGEVSSVTAIAHESGSESSPSQVQTVTSIAPPESTPSPVQTVNAIAPPESTPSPVQTVNAISHPPADAQPASGFVPSRGGQPVVTQLSAEPSGSGDGLDTGYAAIGTGVALLLASLAMLGSSAISGRRQGGSKPGVTVSHAA